MHPLSLHLLAPNGTDGYWTACNNQTLRWNFTQDDPAIFSVALLNPNATSLNGNYQLANSLNTSAGQADIYINCIQPNQGYTVLAVNASQYELNNPQVFTTSAQFEIKPNGTQFSQQQLSGSSSSGSAASSTSSQGQPGAANTGTSAPLATTTSGGRNAAVGTAGSLKQAGTIASGLALVVFGSSLLL